MKINRFITIVIIIIISTGFTACDFLLPAPLGRDNLRDGGVQINSFKSFFSGNDSAELIWNWRTYTGADPSLKIIKVRIVHSENDPPSSMYPLNQNEVKELTTGESFVWKNLKEYRDHYFALYRMEQSGVWLRPLYTNMHIEGAGILDSSSIPQLQYMFVDMVPGTVVQSGSVPLDQAYRGFISVDTGSINDGSYGAVEDAVLRFTFDGSNSVGQIQIVPMYINIHIGESWDDISNPAYYDMEHAVLAQISNTVAIDVQISSVFNRCLTYGTGTFALIIPSGDPGKINDPSTMQLQNLNIWRTN